MPDFLIIFLTAFLPLVIHISGLVVCIGGFRKTGRHLFLYAAFFFGVKILGKWNLPLYLFPAYPFSHTFLSVSEYVSIGLMIITLIAVSFMVWGFYREAER